ncbi:uncharacterized protein LOC126720895 isoform X2 [Quercus robur]|uniref:uncharacterized protein LOC126720895 isoform X2 n=1 Tax=Quercus robur TaxID=38942 RepID=UPI002163F1E0|nr:uncharacterized protein LOC126720895 isoform X2 [Quercus robur]
MGRSFHLTGAGIDRLDGDNYLDWSFQVKTYLMAQDLWNIVEATDESTNAEYDPCWTKQNAMTLHVIHVYCGRRFSSLIWMITSAKFAWDTLAAMFELPRSSYIVDEEETPEAWSVRMKTYLMTIDLWDIVEATTEPPAPEDEIAFNAWRKKNAMALYLIEESSSKFFDAYSNTESNFAFNNFDSTDHRAAKIYWELLEEKLSKETAQTKGTIVHIDEEKARRGREERRNRRLIMERSCHRTGAGIDRLDGDNYLDWSFQVKTYLMAQDLWHIVEVTDESTNAEYDPCWTKQNAMTLHVIHVHCEPRFCSLIRLITSAKFAWDTLAAIFKLPKSSYIVYGNETREAWSVRMKTYLMTIDLWDIVEATTEPPAPEDEIAFNAWSKKNAMALYLITESSSKFSNGSDYYVAGGEFVSIDFDSTDHRTAKICWEILEEKLSKERAQTEGTIVHIDEEEAGRGREERRNRRFKLSSGHDFRKIAIIRSKNNGRCNEITGHHDDQSTNSSGSESSDTDDEYAAYMDLYKAVQSNDWNATEEFFREHPDTIDKKITPRGKTALHVAVAAGHVNMVNELVERMSEVQLLIEDLNGLTALDETTLVGNQEMADCILIKNSNLVSIGDKRKHNPVVLALANGHMNLARYLYLKARPGYLEPENGDHGAPLLTEAIYNRNLDIALDIIRRFPELAIARDRAKRTPLLALASMPYLFSSENSLVFWKRWIYSNIQSTLTTNETRLDVPETEERTSDRSSIVQLVLALLRQLISNLQKYLGIKHLYEMKLLNIQSRELMSCMCEVVSQPNLRERKWKYINEAIFKAIKHGIFEFVSDIVKRNPALLWNRNSDGLTIFQYAVLCREAKIFSLMYKLDAKNAVLSRTDDNGNNILHMAGKLTKSTKLKRIPGAALQMQRELQWFKEVEAVVRPKIRETTNKRGLTPRELFTEEHKDMMKDGEEWMKNTATSCTVVGTLIITIMFAAAFTVPGGNNQNTGYPIFSEKKLFMLFIIADSLSLFSSSTSVMMFLGILTSRYAEEDFLKSLPTKMIIGLATLFFAITTMMIAFSAALLIMQSGNSWIVIPIICLAIVPVTLFIIAQFRLLVDMSMSTYGAGILDRK